MAPFLQVVPRVTEASQKTEAGNQRGRRVMPPKRGGVKEAGSQKEAVKRGEVKKEARSHLNC
jgi:hypothetical protein